MYTTDELKNRYTNAVGKIASKKIIYVEGNRIDKLLYQNLECFKGHIIEPKGSCINVINQVDLNLNSLGVIDKDYNIRSNHDRVFITNYYSIENVQLCNDKRIWKLKVLLLKLGLFSFFRRVKYYKLKSRTYFDKSKGTWRYKVEKGPEKHHEQFNKYIFWRIRSYYRFIKYKELKKTVQDYNKYHKNINGIKDKVWYIHDLYLFVEDKKVFKSSEYRKMCTQL